MSNSGIQYSKESCRFPVVSRTSGHLRPKGKHLKTNLALIKNKIKKKTLPKVWRINRKVSQNLWVVAQRNVALLSFLTDVRIFNLC